MYGSGIHMCSIFFEKNSGFNMAIVNPWVNCCFVLIIILLLIVVVINIRKLSSWITTEIVSSYETSSFEIITISLG